MPPWTRNTAGGWQKVMSRMHWSRSVYGFYQGCSQTSVYVLAIVLLICASLVGNYVNDPLAEMPSPSLPDSVGIDQASSSMKRIKAPKADKVTNDMKGQQDEFPWIIDIISVGSNVRPQYQAVQQRTFGSHHRVRHFWPVTESIDTDRDCPTGLTIEQVHAIRHFCSRRRKPTAVALAFRGLFASPQYLERKGNPAGWLCAQKRPIDALYKIAKGYYSLRHEIDTLPQFLMLVDDDTYVNLPAVLQYFENHSQYYLYDDNHQDSVLGADGTNTNDAPAVLIAGCLARVRWMNFSFPYGGWGTFFSRPTLRRFLQPLYCDFPLLSKKYGYTTTTKTRSETKTWNKAGIEMSQFVLHACERLRDNNMGEANYFQNGMSLLDLLYSYSSHQAYTNFTHWDRFGFCFHSDTALAYFANYYHITDHARSIPGMGHPRKTLWYDEDRIVSYRGSLRFAGQQLPGARKQQKECNHRNTTLCSLDAHLCHYVTPDHMQYLYEQQQKKNDNLPSY